MLSILTSQGFPKSIAMTILSELGDRTFCVAAILAMRYPRKSVLLGCLVSVIATTIISALLGWAAPTLLSEKWTHHITTLLFFGFGLRSLWEGFTEDDDDNEELEEVEKELEKDLKTSAAKSKAISKEDENLKKQHKPFLTRFVSPVFLKAFSLTFFGEWGDKSQLATIGLAADEDVFGVIMGDKQSAQWQLFWVERAWPQEYPRDWSQFWEDFSFWLLVFNLYFPQVKDMFYIK
ncbi:GDT1-like protein 4 isoform X1 [Manihot esculenta]|uniref:GDT1 family protein n=1 Tax=Manihot esculenta TaxID=3983 RepID=A0A2C9WJQ2_MANES|nr:GDT1-like protein 4 isoform X1 [Manihot esculenta]